MTRTTLLPILFALTAIPTACSRANESGQDVRNIQNKGSDTMLEVAQAWAETYHEKNPTIGIAVIGGGSQVGISGIIDGTVDIANCSRELKPEEIEAARKHQHEPVKHHVGYDGIAIYVHKDNPLAAISIEQLKQLYMDGGSMTRWSQLDVKMPQGVDESVVLVSRQSNSGTYEYFREAVLGKTTNFRLGTRDMNGSKDVVDTVSKTRTAIGYSGLSYATPAVRVVPVITKGSDKGVVPSIDTVLDGTYPISRPLFMYTIGEPKDHVKDYLDWIKSDAGQTLLRDKGYPPLRKL